VFSSVLFSLSHFRDEKNGRALAAVTAVLAGGRTDEEPSDYD
jgi:hypothetical protein